MINSKVSIEEITTSSPVYHEDEKSTLTFPIENSTSFFDFFQENFLDQISIVKAPFLLSRKISREVDVCSLFLKPEGQCRQESQDDSTFSNIITFQRIIGYDNNEASSLNIFKVVPEKPHFPLCDKKLPFIIRRRKFSNDSIHKKIKRFFLIFLCQRFKEIFKITSPKIPQQVVMNVSISFNKEMLKLSIKDFYSNLCNTDLQDFHNSEEQTNFLNTSLTSFYDEYLSQKLAYDIDELRQKETREYTMKVYKEAQNFTTYFSVMKPFIKQSKLSQLQ